MTDKLPAQLLTLFQARPPPRHLQPIDYPPELRTTGVPDGLAGFVAALNEEPVPYDATESWVQRRDRERLEKLEAAKKLTTEDAKNYNPKDDPNIKGDAFKTLFVGRLDYTAGEHELKSQFRKYGPIVRIRVPENEMASAQEKKKKAHQGYAFIEFEREKDMQDALRDAKGMMINGRQILVDVERGRTTKGWLPMRFGGGLGGRGASKQVPMGGMPFGGGYPSGRGGFGFRGRGGGFQRGGHGDRYGGGRPGGFGGGRAPDGAPSGPRGPRGGGGYGGDRYNGGGYGGDRYGGDRYSGGGSNGHGGGGGGGRFDDRDRGGRDHGYGGGGGGGGGFRSGGYRDRDQDNNRKRPYDGGGGYDESRQRRRY